MNRLVKTLALTAPLLSAALLSSGSADACGGCFVPPSTNTVVSGHRMALSISMKQTVLWDQIQYQGNPEDFSWVLPIKPGARIEEATSEWFETLEATTSTVVQAPPLNCNNQGQTFGCGSANAGAVFESAGDGAEGPSVNVVHQETVGPYDSVTLNSKDSSALTSWLTMHGYAIPDDIKPVIGAYVSEGFDFIALRLTPGNGVNLMKPVRVITEGASPALPLRMVAAGTGATTSIILYVISEGRWTLENFPEAQVNFNDVVWDGEVNDSNYGDLRLATMSQSAGRTWLASFAQPNAVFTSSGDPYGYSYNGGVGYTYFEQILDNGGSYEEISDCTQKLDTDSTLAGTVVDPCDPVTKTCGTVAPGEIDARDFTCGELTDLSVALTGMHLQDVWITRLEANLPRTALQEDITLQASADQKPIDRYHQVAKAENYECPASPVDPDLKGRKAPPSGNGTPVILAGLGAIAALLAARRFLSIRAIRA